MPSIKPQILIRTEQELIDKLDTIATSQNRSRANLAETILKDYVLKYEMKHGFIDTGKAEYIQKVTQDAIKSAEYHMKQQAKKKEKKEKKKANSLTPNIADLH